MPGIYSWRWKGGSSVNGAKRIQKIEQLELEAHCEVANRREEVTRKYLAIAEWDVPEIDEPTGGDPPYRLGRRNWIIASGRRKPWRILHLASPIR
jgi:hypothetical protein